MKNLQLFKICKQEEIFMEQIFHTFHLLYTNLATQIDQGRSF